MFTMDQLHSLKHEVVCRCSSKFMDSLLTANLSSTSCIIQIIA